MTAQSQAAQTRSKDAGDVQAELDQRFASFGLRPLKEADAWALSMATMVMPDGNPGAEAYLAQVAGVTCFAERLTLWGRVVACGIAGAQHKARNGQRRRTYVEGYDDSWGRYAVADGLTIALWGKATDVLGHGAGNYQGYRRVRDFVGGALSDAIAEFRVALAWATGSQRDRVLEGRWEGITGLNYRDAVADDRMGQPSAHGPMFAPGCGRIVPLKDQAEAYEDQPETLYHGLRPSDWWDEAEARRMRKAPVTMIVNPPPRT